MARWRGSRVTAWASASHAVPRKKRTICPSSSCRDRGPPRSRVLARRVRPGGTIVLYDRTAASRSRSHLPAAVGAFLRIQHADDVPIEIEVAAGGVAQVVGGDQADEPL